MFIKQSANGEWYLCTRVSGYGKGLGKPRNSRNVFLIKNGGKLSGSIGTHPPIIFPKQFIGKKIRFKVEEVILEENKNG